MLQLRGLCSRSRAYRPVPASNNHPTSPKTPAGRLRKFTPTHEGKRATSFTYLERVLLSSARWRCLAAASRARALRAAPRTSMPSRLPIRPVLVVLDVHRFRPAANSGLERTLPTYYQHARRVLRPFDGPWEQDKRRARLLRAISVNFITFAQALNPLRGPDRITRRPPRSRFIYERGAGVRITSSTAFAHTSRVRRSRQLRLRTP